MLQVGEGKLKNARQAMEFLAATKDGLIIYDLNAVEKSSESNGYRDWSQGQAADGMNVKVVASLPSPANAFGHTWSLDGAWLASVSDDGVIVYDANQNYTPKIELPKVAPDVSGRQGGVRNLQFSPKNSFLVTYEKWDPQYTQNVHIWDLRPEKAGTKLHSCTLKHYTSGALPVELIKWTSDEKTCIELVPGEGLLLREGDFSQTDDDEVKMLKSKDISNFKLSDAEQKGASYVACYMPESGLTVAHVSVFHLNDPSKPTITVHLPAKIKDASMLWNLDATALLVHASSDVDETGNSYFGSSYLYWIRSDGKTKIQISGAKEGCVQDIAWSPTKNEFMLIVGMLPASVLLYDGKTGKLISTLGKSRRNTIKYNQFGRFVAVGGFGTLPGDMDFFDRTTEETISSLRASLTVGCAWAPDGRTFLACTVAPRMNEGNQITIYTYSGQTVLHMDYKPENVAARHEDTGAGARTKTQALLFAASWRPMMAFQDRPATPRPGAKRKKGLPEDAAAPATSASAPAYRPRGDGGSSLVAAMMRGEVEAPQEMADRWSVEPAKQLEDWEVRKLERERKKAQEQKEQEEKEKEKQAIRNVEQAEKDNKKKLKALKQQLAELEALKDKEWDELTEEDEERLEGECDLREQISILEKKVQP